MNDFRSAMQSVGLIPPLNLLADGKVHRCQVDKGKRNMDGAYLLFPDGRFGGFENWHSEGKWHRWTSKDFNPTIDTDAIKKVAAARREEAEQSAVLAQAKSYLMWDQAEEGEHPYLEDKGICSNGSRVLGDILLVPMRSPSGDLWSLQRIYKDGSKRFLPGGRVRESSYTLTSTAAGNTVYLCEGFATASSIHAVSGGDTVVMCFACGNMGNVAWMMKRDYQGRDIIVCADNDHKTAGNPGLAKAKSVAVEIGARLAVPSGINGTDFNDAVHEHGHKYVKSILKGAKKP